MKKQIELRKKFLEFCGRNRAKQVPVLPKYEKRHFLTMHQIETFANQQKLRPSRSVIAYFSKIAAVERDCECRIFEPLWRKENPSYARMSNRPEWMQNREGSELVEIEFSNNR
jgi:hypothetical protein